MNTILNEFFLVTIRGRFAYSICCIENAIEVMDKEGLEWFEVFEFLWLYPTANEIRDLGLWHENESEFIPFCVLEDLPYGKKMFDHLTEEKYLRLQKIYNKCNPIICELIDITAWIGIQDLYGGVRNGSPTTLKYLGEVIEIMNKLKIPLPDKEFFKQFSYPLNPKSDWEVWGDRIPIEILKQRSKWIGNVL